MESPLLPVDIVLAPDWWHHNEGITFEEDFFYDPARRVEDERKMERALYERWGRFGLGKDKDRDLPLVGAVHLAAGFMVSEMLGCPVLYSENTPPQVICKNAGGLDIDVEAAFDSPPYRKFTALCDALKAKYGSLAGDVNWTGVLNLALDVRGPEFFIDMKDRPAEVRRFLSAIAEVIERFTQTTASATGTTSISVNRTVRHIEPPVFLHSECSNTMISCSDYEQFLFDLDADWARSYRPFGIHYCGQDPHRYAELFAKLPALDFLDVGWPGDVAALRRSLPETFLNVRLSPVEIIDESPEDIERTIRDLVAASGDPHLTGVCCINMDHNVADEKITAIFETVEKLRQEGASQQ
jgi:hypothetical protein